MKMKMTNSGSQPLRLKDWLIQQIESGKYPGLCWDNPEKTQFRIPWKHASKQDYSEKEDAALFRAWALYKGKFRGGSTKPDPSVWKTRLRCALNKSPDFEEVQEKNNPLDLTEPYKVYRIVNEPQARHEESSREMIRSPCLEEPQRTPRKEESQGTLKKEPQEIPMEREIKQTVQNPSLIQAVNQLKEHPHETLPSPPKHKKMESSSNSADKEYEMREDHYVPKKVADISASLICPSSDFWLHIRLYYQDKLVTEVTTQTAEGCRIVPCNLAAQDLSAFGPLSLQEVALPCPSELPRILSPELALVLQRLLAHLERGVLLWVAPEGVFVKRQCQGRVYWSGPLAPHTDKPNKLEREQTYKVLDTNQFMHELHQYVTYGGPEPRFHIQLCFGEEYPNTSRVNLKKLVTAHVEPVFARELFLNAQNRLNQPREPTNFNG
ncbi:interferon regulatory factor 4 [Bombina bombina]|uniref:interferon regulatory factor 4 n=1 Tax=Bombina bombina TaxID=8345 RepID=UPI00235B0014|nr:interferon regulatory factor 4 [Bombina bombina]